MADSCPNACDWGGGCNNTSCSSPCTWSCHAPCANNCTGTCSARCEDTCYNTGANETCQSCANNDCSSGCGRRCSGDCSSSCGQGCGSGCDGNCNNQCKNGCFGQCNFGCQNDNATTLANQVIRQYPILHMDIKAFVDLLVEECQRRNINITPLTVIENMPVVLAQFDKLDADIRTLGFYDHHDNETTSEQLNYPIFAEHFDNLILDLKDAFNTIIPRP